MKALFLIATIAVLFIGAIIAMSLTLGGKTDPIMRTTTAMVTYTTATNQAMLFLSAKFATTIPSAHLIQPTGELKVSFQIEGNEVDGSCGVTHKNVHYIFGGKKNKRQVLQLDECKIKPGNTVLGFDHENGGCSTSNGVIYLCFDLNYSKRCRKAESPEKEWSELTLSTFDHRLTSIATSTGTTFRIKSVLRSFDCTLSLSISDLFSRTFGRWLGEPIQCQN